MGRIARGLLFQFGKVARGEFMSCDGSCVVVGAACWYGGAPDLRGFWQNILSQRAAFRRLPRERLPLGDYGPQGATTADAVDRTYVTRAAVIDGFEFDWRKRRIPRATYAATDLAHWLALEVALGAAAQAGIDWDATDRQRAAVIVGNSLTGEVSRANALRLRWPYVRRALAVALADAELSDDGRRQVLGLAEKSFKQPFPEPNEDSLAGLLANVIAGRIANTLDLHGGAFTVDGACASSLLAIEMACDGIAAGRWDVALVGGVDISLDPMELTGFARVGAMTRATMRVYDERSSGFLPGEGAGFVVLESAASAARAGRRPLAVVRGWGMSSDGAGGITAPKIEGQAAALRRAYEQAGYPLASVHFIEGHGTGTPLGDKVELSALAEVAGPVDPKAQRAVGVTSVKALFGHTKAAAGVAGFLKAVLAVNQRVLPPLPRFERPNEVLRQPGVALYPLTVGAVLDPREEIRAGVSSAGFGGINCHVTLSSPPAPPIDLGGPAAAELLASHQGAELLVAGAGSRAELDQALATLLRDCEGMADGELVDFCARAASDMAHGDWRVAVVAADASDLTTKLAQARAALEKTFEGVRELPGGEVLIGYAPGAPRVGFLLPGQGAQFMGMGGALVARHSWAAERLARWDEAFSEPGTERLRERLLRPAARAADADMLARWSAALRDTRWAQPAVALTALNWAERLRRLGVTPTVVAGHSLGELPALLLAGAIDEAELIEILKVRSRAAAGGAHGAMASLSCGAEQARALAAAAPGYCVLANQNAPDASVVAGDEQAVAAVERAAAQAGIRSVRLEVSNAFHSRYMEPARAALLALGDRIGGARAVELPFVSALRAEVVDGSVDIVGYAAEQVVAPIRYVDAIGRMASRCDFFLELGPGQIQTGLVKRIVGAQAPAFALEPGGEDSDRALCVALGQLFVRGCPLRMAALFEGRLIRPFVAARDRRFIVNPCEALAPRIEDAPVAVEAPAPVPRRAATAAAAPEARAERDALALLRRVLAEMTGYDEEDIDVGNRLARDLNLDSIKIAEVGAALARRGWSSMPPLELQRATVGEVAAAMRPSATDDSAPDSGAAPSGPAAPAVPVALPELPVRAFAFAWTDATLPEGEPGRAHDAGPIHLLFDARHSATALGVAAAFAASGQACLLLPWGPGSAMPSLPAGAVARLAALVPAVAPRAPLADPRFAEDLAAYLVAMGSLLAGGATEFMAIAVHDAATPALPVDGLGAAATVLLEGLTRHVRVVSLAGLPRHLDALRAPAEEPLEYLRISADGALARGRLEVVADWQSNEPELCLEDGDLVVATGGLRGITAECLLALAGQRRLRFLVVGRSNADALDAEARDNLRRLRESCLKATYVACDVGDAAALRTALAPVVARLGPVRGIVHGAGLNAAAGLGRIEAVNVAREIATKATGLAGLLALADLAQLRLCVGLGSVIAVTGMHGNAGYALANELLAAQLAQLKREQPHIVVACPAFSVWREVGMGAKMASSALDSILGAGGIAPAVGAQAFLSCARRGTPDLPLIVAPPLTGLATWRHLRHSAAPVTARFLTPLVLHEPELALVARPQLNRERDPYLDQHRFNGTPLFPTVFALKAFVSAAVALRAVAVGAAVAISDIVLSRPIVVEDGATRTIEVGALRLDGYEDAVGVAIGDPGRAFEDPVFAGTVAAARGEDVGAPVVAGQAPTTDLSDQLYEGLLFQGGPFQRIEKVERLDDSDPAHPAGLFVIRREPDPAFLHLADPYFIDAMLQTVQVLVPQDVCLPRAIARATLCPALRRAGAARVVARVAERTADGYLCEVVAVDPADGSLVARLEGYDVGIVEHRAQRPALAALFDPLAEDRRRIAAAATRLRGLGLDPASDLAATGTRRDEAQAARRERARALVGELVGTAVRLDWDRDGRPLLSGDEDRGISISHSGGRMIAVRAARGVGCDLELVRRRPRAEWAAILPPAYGDLAVALVKRSVGPDAAATLAWTAYECLVKAGRRDATPRLAQAGEDGVVLDLAGQADGGGRVFATWLDLALAGPCALAVFDPRAAAPAAPEQAPERVFRHRFRPSFRDIMTPRRTVPAHTFFGWIGTARELAMASIHEPLAAAFDPAQGHAMVTNFSEVELHAPTGFGREIEVVVWLDRMVEEQPSTFELCFLWRLADDPGAVPLASARQRLTWVRASEAGAFRPEPLPDFFGDFLAARRLEPGAAQSLLGGTAPPARFADERRWRKGAGATEPVAPLTMAFDTDLSHSNFVANIYFSHYGTMFERAALRMLGGASTSAWDSLVVSWLRVDHLGEARPGDQLAAEVELESIGARSLVVSGRFVNRSHGAAAIAAARARLRPLLASSHGPHWGEDLPPADASMAAEERRQAVG